MQSRLAQMYEEHGSIAAVLNALIALIDEVRTHGRRVDVQVFRTMLYYLDVFPEREHHRKEEAVLFARLRERTHEIDDVLDDLSREHAVGEQEIRTLEQAFVRYEASPSEFPAFAAEAQCYAARYFEHMHKEEHLVMPVARRVLTAQDFIEIEAAFAAPRDPLAGGRPVTDPDELFRKLVAIVPAPYGVGEPLA